MDGVSAMPDNIQAYLEVDDTVLDARWARLEAWVKDHFKRDVTLEAILFLIGVQSKGHGFEPSLKKEAKQDLIMEGTYCAFETLDLYRRVGMEADGRWLWERTTPMPDLSVEAQEKLLRLAVLRYFEDLGLGEE